MLPMEAVKVDYFPEVTIPQKWRSLKCVRYLQQEQCLGSTTTEMGIYIISSIYPVKCCICMRIQVIDALGVSRQVATTTAAVYLRR